MPSNDRSHGARAALPSPWLVATAAAVGLFAVLALLLLRPPAGNAAPAAACSFPAAISGGQNFVHVPLQELLPFLSALNR